MLFVCLAWTLFRSPDFATALDMYAGQFGLHGIALGEAMAVSLRPVHALAAVLGVLAILAPLLQPTVEKHVADHPLSVLVASLWPVLGFALSFCLIASRESVPFLYFQF
ncbi:hypothetical protein D3C71_1808850 [compost metagenome]